MSTFTKNYHWLQYTNPPWAIKTTIIEIKIKITSLEIEIVHQQKKKKELNDYVYYTGSHKQASDYEKTTEFLINYIKEEYTHGNNTAESIRNGRYSYTLEWYPKLEISMEMDPDRKKIMDIELQMKYKAQLDATIKRETTFESNKTKAYLLIWERCTLLMQG